MVKKGQNFRRIVIKIGSSLLVDGTRGLRQEWLDSLCEDVSQVMGSGSDVAIVSSGAIALGRGELSLTRSRLKLEESQAAAAAGQILLSRAYSESLGRYGLRAGQVLLTIGDTRERRRYLNARETINTLLKLGSVPIINENDTVATSEIRYGDNDRLAAGVATMIGADLLVLLSDVDGFYTGIPGKDKDARRFDRIREITPDIEAMAGDAGTDLSRGGMVTKLEAARIATSAGTTMVIASGRENHALRQLLEGGVSTWFDAQESPLAARKKWIGGQPDISGTLVVDDGAASALQNGRSLLSAGITGVSGGFQRGDFVQVQTNSGMVLGRGIVAYDAVDVEKIAGKRSDVLEGVLGFPARGAVIHRDNLVLSEHGKKAETNDA